MKTGYPTRTTVFLYLCKSSGTCIARAQIIASSCTSYKGTHTDCGFLYPLLEKCFSPTEIFIREIE